MLDPRPALDGGRPVRSAPVSSWPRLDKDEIEAACRVLQSGRVSYWTGVEGRLFEEECAAFTGTPYAVALANQTAALAAALISLDPQPGDEIVAPYTSFALLSACSALHDTVPVMADVDRQTGTITARTIADVLTPRTVGILSGHPAGRPCDMAPILELAKRKGLWVVEDSVQAFGAMYKDQRVGALGDAGIFSFCPQGLICAAGEGGMVVTSRRDIWERVWSFKDHGKSFDAIYHREHPRGFRWLHESFGTNWRLTELQSAVGRLQLRKLPLWLNLLRRNAEALTEGFSAMPGLRLPRPAIDADHAWHFFPVFIEPDACKPGWDGDRIAMYVRAEGIPCIRDTLREGTCRQYGILKALEGCPVTRELEATRLLFMSHPALGVADMEETVQAVAKAMRRAVR